MEGLVAANGYTAGSIDTPYADSDAGGDGEGRTLGETFGECDPAMDLFEDIHALAPLIEQLPERSRLLLQLRFGEEMTQAQIGEQLGCSQMHVSRLLSRTIARLRSGLLTED
jgi:RNA polymerase sigma-B factor